ncbi:uncharacterized protein EAE98_000032 [Botrytis deweyae]|uniref:Uncharacterized protein n=1 Tax=Botrytis deweyae TaxID=2478750 RepID=A0ABQ7J1I7_9HELO|nr:uncharacterized protein EAE98_000032 [Botrytis deweyae]KAF7939905.1 hypothetical protein EAE98_000032 [Botrytis deweyae]
MHAEKKESHHLVGGAPADQVSRSHFSTGPSAKPCNPDGAPSSEVAYTMYACLVQTLLKFWENLQNISHV